jgi:exosome complex RNA-binding protein Rrp42 (RNase PH superfamily)
LATVRNKTNITKELSKTDKSTLAANFERNDGENKSKMNKYKIIRIEVNPIPTNIGSVSVKLG